MNRFFLCLSLLVPWLSFLLFIFFHDSPFSPFLPFFPLDFLLSGAYLVILLNCSIAAYSLDNPFLFIHGPCAILSIPPCHSLHLLARSFSTTIT